MYTHIPIALSYELGGMGFEFQKVQQISPSPKPPDRSFVTHILLFNGCLNFQPGIKWPMWEANHSFPSGADVKMSGAIAPLYLSLHGMDREILLYTLTRMYGYLQQYLLIIYGYIPMYSEKGTVTQ